MAASGRPLGCGTVSLLWRLAKALDGTLSIELDSDGSAVKFAAHRLAA